jgi:orotidine-5'-phosphate decarboxylase
MTFADKLKRAGTRGNLCVGLDPMPERLPDELQGRRHGIARFLERIVEATAPWAAAFKPNLAFFEALGPEGEEALGRTIDAVRKHAPDALLVGDGKRGDIGSTAERYAAAMFERWAFDAATVNPYFGDDGVLPFVERPGHGAYVLAATSNPSAEQLQGLGGEEGLAGEVAELAAANWNQHGNVGLVVGATRVDMLERLRRRAPDLPWLIPGVGAQGGDLAGALEHGMAGGVRSLINSSRGILYASSGEDYAEAAGGEAKRLHEAMEAAKS